MITRWGTWLEAAFYYRQHFEAFKVVIENLGIDAVSVKTCKEVIQDSKLLPQLIYIASNFKAIPVVIDKLQSHTILLTSGVHEVEKLSQTNFQGAVGQTIKRKFEAVLQRNPGWEELQSLSKVLSGEEASIKEGWTSQDIICMKHAPVSSADVERSFSKMKYLLSDRRLNFTIENMAAHLIIFLQIQK